MLNTSKIRFIFKDGSQKEIPINGCFKGLRKNGERPISACIDLHGTVAMHILQDICHDIYLVLSPRSTKEDVVIFGIVPQERMNG